MPRIPALVALSFAALPAAALAQGQPAQPATPPAPSQTPVPAPSAPAAPQSPEVNALQQAGMAFGQCIQAGVAAVPASVTPETGATSVVNGCTTQRRQLEQAAEAFIGTLPENARPTAQEQLRTQLASVEGQVAAGIRQARATPAPAPTPGN